MFNPSNYPRTYTATPGWRTFMLFGSIFVSLCGFLLASIGFFAPMPSKAAVWIVGAMGISMVLLSAYSIIDTYRLRIELRPDAILCRSFWGTRVLGRSAIRGARLARVGPGPRMLILRPQDKLQTDVKLAMMMRMDIYFSEWFAEILDLDHLGIKRS